MPWEQLDLMGALLIKIWTSIGYVVAFAKDGRFLFQAWLAFPL